MVFSPCVRNTASIREDWDQSLLSLRLKDFQSEIPPRLERIETSFASKPSVKYSSSEIPPRLERIETSKTSIKIFFLLQVRNTASIREDWDLSNESELSLSIMVRNTASIREDWDSIFSIFSIFSILSEIPPRLERIETWYFLYQSFQYQSQKYRLG